MTAQYNHSQTTPATTWTINHNLNSDSVAVDVMIDFGSPSQLQKVLPQSIEVTSANQVVVTFSGNQTGKARIVGEF